MALKGDYITMCLLGYMSVLVSMHVCVSVYMCEYCAFVCVHVCVALPVYQ